MVPIANEMNKVIEYADGDVLMFVYYARKRDFIPIAIDQIGLMFSSSHLDSHFIEKALKELNFSVFSAKFINKTPKFHIKTKYVMVKKTFAVKLKMQNYFASFDQYGPSFSIGHESWNNDVQRIDSLLKGTPHEEAREVKDVPF